MKVPPSPNEYLEYIDAHSHLMSELTLRKAISKLDLQVRLKQQPPNSQFAPRSSLDFRFRVGDRVTFWAGKLSNPDQQIKGILVRVNPKTVTVRELDTNFNWRVHPSLLSLMATQTNDAEV